MKRSHQHLWIPLLLLVFISQSLAASLSICKSESPTAHTAIALEQAQNNCHSDVELNSINTHANESSCQLQCDCCTAASMAYRPFAVHSRFSSLGDLIVLSQLNTPLNTADSLFRPPIYA